MCDYVKGDKVKIPKTKSVGWSIGSSSVIKRAKERKQNFLYFSYSTGRRVVLCDSSVNSGGDYFLLSDLRGKFVGNKMNW